MIEHCRSRRRGRAAKLLTSVGAVLVASVWLAPVVGAQAGPTAPHWTVEVSPNPQGALGSGLAAVSCSGPDRCVAVGAASFSSGQQIPDQHALVELLANGTWTMASTPAVSGATSVSLSDVSCPLPDSCVAVGSAQFAAPHRSPVALAEVWNGTSWSDRLLPIPLGGSEPSLSAVSCATIAVCVAVGNYFDNKTNTSRPLTEQMDSSTWSVVPTPLPPIGGNTIANSRFTDVDCPAPALCDVVGDVTYNDTLQKVFAYGFNGSAWAYQPQVNPGPDPGNTDGAVSCSSTDACTSVGWVSIIGETALVEHWDGSTWVRQATPTPVNRPDDALYDVSCNGGSFCIALGESYRVNQTNGHLIDGRVMGETWNGSAWSQSPPVVPSGVSAALGGVSCPAPTTCIAVGSASTASSETTLIEEYTG